MTFKEYYAMRVAPLAGNLEAPVQPGRAPITGPKKVDLPKSPKQPYGDLLPLFGKRQLPQTGAEATSNFLGSGNA